MVRVLTEVSELHKIISSLGKNSWSPRKDVFASDAVAQRSAYGPLLEAENPIVRLELSRLAWSMVQRPACFIVPLCCASRG